MPSGFYNPSYIKANTPIVTIKNYNSIIKLDK
jgi:hypothetical protein